MALGTSDISIICHSLVLAEKRRMANISRWRLEGRRTIRSRLTGVSPCAISPYSSLLYCTVIRHTQAVRCLAWMGCLCRYIKETWTSTVSSYGCRPASPSTKDHQVKGTIGGFSLGLHPAAVWKSSTESFPLRF
jgi:hypothetical protein